MTRTHHQRTPDEHPINTGLGINPGPIVVFIPCAQNPGNGTLRPSVDERRVMRERAAVPVKRSFHVRPRADILEYTLVASHEPQVQAIRMAVAATGVAVVEGGVYTAPFAPQDRKALAVHQCRRRGSDVRGRNLRQRVEQRLPSEVSSRQADAWNVSLCFSG